MAKDNQAIIKKLVSSVTEKFFQSLGYKLKAQVLINTSFFSKKIKSGQENSLAVKVLGAEEVGILIGFKGETLNSLQTILSLLINKQIKEKLKDKEAAGWWFISLDVGGWREEREESLIEIAEKAAQRAIASGENVPLSAMGAHERRILHVYLNSKKEIESASVGEEPNRRIVIRPK